MSINKTVSRGRPETDVIVMFKMLVLQQWHGLSDFELEKQCIDRISFRKFLGFPEYVPDSTTVWLFRERIIENFKENMGKVAKPTCCSGFTDKAGNDSGCYFYPFRSRTCKSREMRQKQEEAEKEHGQRREVSLTLDISFII